MFEINNAFILAPIVNQIGGLDLVAVLSQGIVPTDITFRNVDDCYKQAGQAAFMARNAKAEIAEAKAEDIELNKYACVLMDD